MIEERRRRLSATIIHQSTIIYECSRRPIILSTYFLFFLLPACGTVPKRTPENYSQNLQSQVDALALPLIQRSETPGMVVGVLLPDHSMRFFGYGVTDRGSKKTPDGDTLFAIGSLTKGFVGAAAAILVQEGKISWNDPLEKFLPPDAPLSSDAKKITLIQLATHTSGLPTQPKTFRTLRYVLGYFFTGNSFYRHFDQDYVFKYLADFQSPKHPSVHYSSLGYALLGYALEQRTGLTLEALLDQKLFQPLGLKNTGYIPESLPGYEVRARGHAGDEPKLILRGRPVPDWRFTEFMKGSAGLYSTARDLLTFASAFIPENGSTLAPTLAETLQPRVPLPKQAPAVAWFVNPMENHQIAYQMGLVGGFTSYLGIDPQRRTAVVVLQNSFNWTDKVGGALLAIVIK